MLWQEKEDTDISSGFIHSAQVLFQNLDFGFYMGLWVWQGLLDKDQRIWQGGAWVYLEDSERSSEKLHWGCFSQPKCNEGMPGSEEV